MDFLGRAKMITVFDDREKQVWFEETANIIHSCHGDNSQRYKLAEECGEYASAICKYHTDKSDKNRLHCIEEMADVILVLQQVLNAMPVTEKTELCNFLTTKGMRELNRISQKQHEKRIANTFKPNKTELKILESCKEGNMSSSDLAEILDTNPSRAGKVALRLERAGLLKTDYDSRAVINQGIPRICRIKVYETTNIGNMVLNGGENVRLN